MFWVGFYVFVESKMASASARFPASAQMQKMANMPQQSGMFPRPQFGQTPYGMQVILPGLF